ncbi:tetratricopeptide repeat protein [Stieleria varia]|uniref:tetratricopeptide repeat protein n=1 Tax=Stieleria varia TaxID=2528005 RepID=UPI001E49E04B|nr:tetratricopeptide repeat protein [Stieleria varia]
MSRILLIAFLLISICADAMGTETAPSAGQQAMLALMQQKVAERPKHSDSWRVLGRVQKALGQTDDAIQSVRRAVALDDENAAAHFDLGQLLLQGPETSEAQSHFNKVFQIAPASSYAAELTTQGIPMTNDPSDHPMGMPVMRPSSGPSMGIENSATKSESPFTTVGYEMQSFDGADDLETRLDSLESEVSTPTHRLRVFLETGVLYNSNVTLTPVSRELVQSDSASYQAFASPDIDWKVLRTDTMRMGPLFRGYFTANESAFESFNLASFQPGAFWERDFTLLDSEVIGRLDYVYSTDYFDWVSVGNRHAWTASMTVIRPDLKAIYGYLTLADSDFSDDGQTPGQTSLDGITYSVGISEFFQTGWDGMPTFSLGLDGQWADTVGADYRYQSINLHGSSQCKVSSRWSFVPTWGVGYRAYDDFTGTVSRDELFWRLHGRLSYQWTELLAWSIVAGHDRFATDNEDFDTQRTEGGLVLTVTR